MNIHNKYAALSLEDKVERLETVMKYLYLLMDVTDPKEAVMLDTIVYYEDIRGVVAEKVKKV